MGACQSRLEGEEAVARCKARRRYMKHLVAERQAFAAAHSLYLRSLRSTGAALLQFANTETHHHPPIASTSPTPTPPPPPPSPPPPPAMNPCSDNWTSSVTASPVLRPPPPPLPPSSSWDFWDPFVLSSTQSVIEEWKEATATVTEVTAAPAVAPEPSVVSGFSKDSTSEIAVVVVPRSRKDLSEIVKELEEYFLKAADSGSRVSVLLEASNCEVPSSQGLTGKVCSYGKSLNPLLWTWGSNSKASGCTRFARCGEEMEKANDDGVGSGSMSHSSTVEKLYAWEKKLFLEVKNSLKLKEEHERRVGLLRKQEAQGVDYVKVEKNKKEIDRLVSKMLVSSEAIETTTSEIIRLRDSQLFPQLLELVTGLMGMWRSMHECHQVQTNIVQQLEYLNNASSTNPTTDKHRHASLQLEHEVNHWYSAFCGLVKSQREYIYALSGWLRLSLFQCDLNMLGKSQQISNIYSLCEKWQLAFDQIPDKVASEGIKSFLTAIQAVVIQQVEEQKQKRKSELAFKELEKRAEELKAMESKYAYSVTEGPGEMAPKYPAMEKRAKVEALKTKAEEEKSKHEKSIAVTRAMTLNNLQTGLPNVFRAMTGFASECMQAFESVYNHQSRSDRVT